MDDGDLDTKDIGDLANSTGKKEALQPSDKKRKNCYSSGRVGAKGTDATYSPMEKRKRFHDRSYSQPNTVKHAQQICIPGFQYNYWTRWESPQLLRSKTSKYTYIQCRNIFSFKVRTYVSQKEGCRLSLNVHLYIIFLRTTNAMDPEVPAVYHNLGSSSYQYSMCNATMWYNERSNNARNDVTPSFALCCQEGKVLLPRFSDTPQPLKKLLDYNDPTTSRFKDQIKVYNNIFGFTSFGARIDHSVNSGRGTYTFRINGSNYHRMGSLLPSEGVPLRLLSERIATRQDNAPTVSEVAALIINDFGDGLPTRDMVVNKNNTSPRISELHPSYMELQYPLLFMYGEDGYHENIPYHSNGGNRKTKRGYVTMKE
nr:putative PIF1 DNA helicase/replication protein A1-like protein [Tanacetum cinerariifolium]